MSTIQKAESSSHHADTPQAEHPQDDATNNPSLESKKTQPIGSAWLPKGTHPNIRPLFECKCVQDGVIVLVESEHPDNLIKEHRNGDWCPCSGMDKKWIYLNDPSV